MKKVLLTSTALVMTAGVAAAEMTMSASASLTYGNFGTGNYRAGYTVPLNGTTAGGAAAAIPGVAHTSATADATIGGAANVSYTAADQTAGNNARAAQIALRAAALAPTAAETLAEEAADITAMQLNRALRQTVPDSSWSSEADLNIAGSGGGGNITYTASLELDEGSAGVGPITIASGGLTFKYDANDIGTLVTGGADGEDDKTGDYMVSYAAGGLSASYESDTGVEDNEIKVGYSSGDLTIGLTLDENDGATGGDATTTTSVGYTMGDAVINVSADDADTYDLSVAYTSGSTVMTIGADENSIYSLKLAYASGDMTFSARQEFGGTAAGDSETEFGLTYSAGDLTFGAAYDSGQAGKFGDEAETRINASYAIDGATIAAKANDQDEVEVSVSFAF